MEARLHSVRETANMKRETSGDTPIPKGRMEKMEARLHSVRETADVKQAEIPLSSRGKFGTGSKGGMEKMEARLHSVRETANMKPGTSGDTPIPKGGMEKMDSPRKSFGQCSIFNTQGKDGDLAGFTGWEGFREEGKKK